MNLAIKTLMYLPFLHDHVCELVVLHLFCIQVVDNGQLVWVGTRVQHVLDVAVHMGTDGVVQDR